MKKKISVSTIFLAIFIVFSLNSSVLAGQPSSTATKVQTNKKASDAMWRAVEGSFHLSAEYKRGDSSYEIRGTRAIWQLNWVNNKRATMAHAEIDAETQQIISFYRYDTYSGGYKVKLPAISKEKARTIAEKAANTLDPYKLKNSRLSYATKSDFAQSYQFSWTRIVYGIPYPEDFVSITVDGQTGKISSYQSAWHYDAVFPKPDIKINAVEARKKLLHTLPLRLEFADQWTAQGRKTSLVYQTPPALSSMRVNALNRKIITSGAALPIYKKVYDFIKWESVFELKPINSKEDLLDRIYPMISEKEGFSLQRINSYSDPNYGKTLSAEYSKTQDNQYSSMYFQFAADGNLINYSKYTNVPSKAKYKIQECKTKAYEYLGKYYMLPDKENLYLVEESKAAVQPLVTFTFIKKVNGYPYPGHFVSITVNAEDLSLYSFYVQMPKTNFIIPTKIKPDWKVLQNLIPENGMKLQYQTITQKNKTKAIALVYVPKWQVKGPLYADANLDVKAKAANKKPAPLHIYSDMKNSPDENIINNLTKQGIIRTLAGSKFKPNVYISKADFIDMVVRMQIAKGKIDPYNIKIKKRVFKDVKTGDLYYVPIYLAYQNGLIKEQAYLKPNAKITKEEMAYILARALGYSKLATKDEIFILNYKDADKINPEFIAEVALMDSQGLLKGSTYYNPKRHYTRLNAAKLIAKILNMS